jgi:hypothetical protein
MKIENIRIKILKDTPFNIAGDILKLTNFRYIYNYICADSITNEELVKYIKDWKSYPVLKQTTKYCINEWFEVIELEDLEPPTFIYEGLYYTKEMDGFYHVWANPQQRNLFMNGDKAQKPIAMECISTIRSIVERAKYKQEIPYYTNSINNKL